MARLGLMDADAVEVKGGLFLSHRRAHGPAVEQMAPQETSRTLFRLRRIPQSVRRARLADPATGGAPSRPPRTHFMRLAKIVAAGSAGVML